MTVRDALREGVAVLGASETPFLDASLLLSRALGLDRSSLFARGPEALRSEDEFAYRAFLDERAGGRPVAYILGEKEFWGRIFRVDRRALVPRPETELLVSAALQEGEALISAGASMPRVHELCCGSGCVILSIAADRPEWPVSASDLSPEALSLARENALLLGAEGRPGGPCTFFRADLLEGLSGPYDLILANPPYVPSAELDLLDRELGWEPRMALDGGDDGMAFYRRLVPQAASRLSAGGWLILEADGSQAPILRDLLAQEGFLEVRSDRDLAGIERITRGRLPWKV